MDIFTKLNYRTFILFIFILSSCPVSAQSKNIFTIFQNNCVACHKKDGNAPFALTSYDAIKKRAPIIAIVVKKNIMPWWQPDTTYSRFAHERILPSEDKEAILKWIKKKCPKNMYIMDSSMLIDKLSANTVTDYDTVICFSKKYEIKKVDFEQQPNYIFPYIQPKDKYLTALKYLFYDNAIIHHAILYTVSGGSTYYEELNPQNIPNESNRKFLETYGAGYPTIEYPEGYGTLIKAGSRFMINSHYPLLKVDSYDSTCLSLKFLPTQPEREVFIAGLDFVKTTAGNSVFAFPKNEITEIVEFRTIDIPINIISLYPHMHMIGKSFESYAITPDNRTIPLIRINKWDFYKQEEYFVKSPIYLPSGTKIYVKAVFDNTDKNVVNPFMPPQNISFGSFSTEEMLQLVVTYF